jgi:amino acid adenylation domain-containing protein
MTSSDKLEYKKNEIYWISKLTKSLSETEFISAFNTDEKESLEFHIDLKKETRLFKVTQGGIQNLYLIFYTVTIALLHKLFLSKEILVSSIFSALHNQFIFPRISFVGNENFKTLLSQCQKEITDSIKHKDYDFDSLVKSLVDIHSVEKENLFNIGFFTDFDSDDLIKKFQIAFKCNFANDHVYVSILYHKSLSYFFTKDTEYRYNTILNTLLNQNDKKLSEIDFLSESEKKQLLVDFNDTAVDYPRDKTIVDLFEEQVEKNPTGIAVVFEEKKLTYRELNEKANQVARYMRLKYTIEPDDKVAIILERSEFLIVSMLAILKSGAAFIPIDPESPEKQKRYILNDANVKAVLLHEKESIEIVDSLSCGIIELSKFDETFSGISKENLQSINSAKDLAYIIYTSGSTGKPKGVMVEHRSVVNYSYFYNDKISKSENEVFSLFSSTAFDLAYSNIWPAILFSHELCIFKSEAEFDPISFLRFLAKHQITILKLTPSHLKMLIEGLLSIKEKLKFSLKTIVLGGESPNINDLNVFYKYIHVNFINHYGPTEATIGCITSPINSINEVHGTNIIGKPIYNTNVYILNANKKINAIGVFGEIAISGSGLARAYLNQEALTEEKFIANPYSKDESDKRLYLTGDLGRRLSDGNIEYLGRIDEQVKIRGYRVELGEIEAQLKFYHGIRNAVVLYDKKQSVLLAVIESDGDLNVEDLRNHLSLSLPSYMIPLNIMNVREIPLTGNGKADRKRLSELYKDEDLRKKEYIAPETETEKILVGIWEEILGKENISIEDNFFKLGGHSIKAMQVISRISIAFNIEISPKLLFSALTVKAIGLEIDKMLLISKVKNSGIRNESERIKI